MRIENNNIQTSNLLEVRKVEGSKVSLRIVGTANVKRTKKQQTADRIEGLRTKLNELRKKQIALESKIEKKAIKRIARLNSANKPTIKLSQAKD